MRNGSSLLILAGSNTYTGQTTNQRRHFADWQRRRTTGSVGSTSGVADSGLLAFDLSTAATFSQTITGSGGLMQMGPSVLTLTGSNTYAGLTTIASGGTLQIGNGSTGSINSTSGVADNGLLAFDLSSGTTTVGNSITGIGGLLQMANVLALTGSNTYSGPTTISAGTIQLGGSTSLGNLPAVSINSSTGELDLHGYSPTIISLTGSGTLINSSVSSTSTLTLCADVRHEHLQRRHHQRCGHCRPDCPRRRHRGPRRQQYLHRPDHDQRRHLADRQRRHVRLDQRRQHRDRQQPAGVRSRAR